jgi:hypothetical protein
VPFGFDWMDGRDLRASQYPIRDLAGGPQVVLAHDRQAVRPAVGPLGPFGGGRVAVAVGDGLPMVTWRVALPMTARLTWVGGSSWASPWSRMQLPPEATR